MKVKSLSILFLLSFTPLSFSQTDTNLSDAIDQNEIEAEKERRQGGVRNIPDPLDENKTPDVLEERQKEEEWRESYDEVQKDQRIYDEGKEAE